MYYINVLYESCENADPTKRLAIFLHIHHRHESSDDENQKPN